MHCSLGGGASPPLHGVSENPKTSRTRKRAACHAQNTRRVCLLPGAGQGRRMAMQGPARLASGAVLAFGAMLAPAAAAPARRLAAGATLDEHLAPACHARFRVPLQPGQAVDLALVQFDANLQVHWRAGSQLSPLLQNDAGRHARLRLTLVAEQAGEMDLDVAAKGEVAAHYSLQMGRPHAATAQDRQRSLAQRALAEAENLRRTAGSQEPGKPADEADLPARVLAEYQAAIDAANAAGDACTASMARAGLARWHFAHGDYAQARSLAEAALPMRCGAADTSSSA